MKSFALLLWLPRFLAPLPLSAQLTERRGEHLESRVDRIERTTRTYGGAAGVLAALGAQNTRRNAWLWFFTGLFFAPITLIVLLYQNAHDPRLSGSQPAGIPPT